ncbi:hypothetical protein K431DRAFT_219972 [Polychaeton citri CBS 116435]|uniref:Uncharacterized protein n=1 Tax=Polychaeton citri CBS 116435 TaxID=1314669 RepID=A0A9P4UPJ5_9PEZI|nr:hypothetical protein K431DRAFT_219972 [Polychaeton citri CBS 116435]
MSSVVSSQYPSRASSPATRNPFRFFDLPSELRLRIYEEALLVDEPLDLNTSNYRTIRPRLNLFLVSHRMYDEATRVFYSQTVRLYPRPGRFEQTKRPLLARLSPATRAKITTLELRLGTGWTSPPRCQNTNESLGLRDCISLKKLKIMVEIDLSNDVFNGFRGKGATKETYSLFSMGLLQGIFEQAPSLWAVEIDAYPSVKKDAPLVVGLRKMIDEHKKTLLWGPLRGWEKDSDEPGSIGLEGALARLGISDSPRLVTVGA